MSAVSKIDDSKLQHDWMRLRPLILKAVKFIDGYDEEHLLKGVICGEFTFWPGKNCFIISAIDKFPTLTQLNLILAGGDHNEVAEIEPRIIKWAKRQGATQSFTAARLGLDRLNIGGKSGYYADRGYKRSRIVYVKEI